MKVIFIVILLFLLSLFFREQTLPASWVDSLCDRFSGDGMLLRCDRATFGFRSGLGISGVRLYDGTSSNSIATVASAGWIKVNPFTRRVRIYGAKYPKLPDSYYAPQYMERNLDLDIELADIPEFDLTLERPEILGLRPELATGRVKVARRAVTLDNATVVWEENDPSMAVVGGCRLDFFSQRFVARIRGFARQKDIRPLLVVLDIPAAMPYFDAFTEVPKPVSARADFDVNLRNCDFDMKLDLRPELGRYNGVPMRRAHGEIDVENRIRGTNCNTYVKIDLPTAIDPNGRKLAGVLDILTTNNVTRLGVEMRSDLMLGDILDIADFLDPAVVEGVACEEAPTIIARGRAGTSVEDIDWNDVDGSVHAPRLTVYGMKLHNYEFDYALRRDKLDIKRARALGKRGGSLTGESHFDFHGFGDSPATCSMTVDYRHGELDELSDLLDMDLAGRDGKVDAHIELAGDCEGTNVLASLNGKASVKVTEGRLLQMNLFAGLTTLLAEKVPGVDYIVNQSDASADFTVTNGIVKTENLYLEGGLISLKGFGTYDIPADSLDFTVRVQFMKKESIMGMILHPIAFPFTKLLLEFKASGSIGDPKWQYISIIDRVF